MSGHAFLAPSGAEQWGPGRCPGAPAMQALFPEEESESAREGTAGHDYCKEALTTGLLLTVGTLASNNIPITDEMIKAAEEYIADCLADRHAGGECYVEQRVFAHNSIHPSNDGTPDHFAVWRGQRIIKLKDYKFGHKYVDAFRNLQLANYLIAIFETLQLGPYDGWTIEATIYQPRNYHPEGHVRTWRPTGVELETIRQELAAAATAATTPGAPCVTGSHCVHCTAARGCTVLQNATSAIVDMTGEQRPHVLDNDALGKELRMLRAADNRLNARIEALEEQALNELASGRRVSHFTGEYSYGREKFILPPEQVIAWCDALGVDVRAPLATKTPAQIRKLGIAPALMPASEKPRAAFTLVEVTPHSLAKGMSHGR